MGDHPHDYPTMSLDDMYTQADTGDIVLFHGHSKESRTIEFVTGSAFSHVGMVFVDPRSANKMLWQTGPDPIEEDPETKTRHGGAQCAMLKKVLTDMNSPKYGDTPHWRQLSGVTRDGAFHKAVVKAVEKIEGKPFPSLWAMLEHFAEGQLHISDSGSTYFCAELIAVTYQLQSLLPADDPPRNWYDPKAFSEEYHELPLQNGAELGQTYRITTP